MAKEKAVIYARVSSKEQELGGFSIPAQLDILQKYCSDHNFEIIKTFKESSSAKETGTRPAYNEMIRFLRRTKSRIHLVYEKNDRLLRNEYDSADIINLARTTQHHIHSVRESLELYKLAHPSVFYIFTMFSANSSIYSRNLSLEVRKGMNKAADMGYYPSKLPCGYKRGDFIKGERNKRRKIVIDTEKAGYILRVYELYSTGMYSFSMLAKKMADEGFYYSKNLCTKANIEYILKNPFYSGQFLYNGKMYQTNQYTPIIPYDLYVQCNRIRQRNTVQKVQEHEFLYSGLIKCSRCGCCLIGEIKKSKYIYYSCRGRKCPIKTKKMLKEEYIDKLVESLLKSISVPAESIDMILSQTKKVLNNQIEYEKKSTENIENEIKKLKKRLNNLYNDKLDGNIDAVFYEEKRMAFQEELDNLIVSLHQNYSETDEIMAKAELCIELCKNAWGKYLQYSIEQKRYMLKLLVSNFYYDGENLRIDLKSTVKTMLESAYSNKWWALEDSNF